MMAWQTNTMKYPESYIDKDYLESLEFSNTFIQVRLFETTSAFYYMK